MASQSDINIDCSYNVERPTGKIYVDSQKGPITIYLMNLNQTTPVNGQLEIIKISTDHHPITLFAHQCKIGDNYDIYTFGYKGKAGVQLSFDGERWKHRSH